MGKIEQNQGIKISETDNMKQDDENCASIENNYNKCTGISDTIIFIFMDFKKIEISVFTVAILRKKEPSKDRAPLMIFAHSLPTKVLVPKPFILPSVEIYLRDCSASK